MWMYTRFVFHEKIYVKRPKTKMCMYLFVCIHAISIAQVLDKSSYVPDDLTCLFVSVYFA